MIRVNLLDSTTRRKLANKASAYRSVAANPVRVAENKRRYAQRHPDRCSEARRRWRETHPELDKAVKSNSHLRITYGITANEYIDLHAKQEGKCAICGGTNGDRLLAVDHEHGTSRVRGLLCGRCNTSLERLERDGMWAAKALAYLAKDSATHKHAEAPGSGRRGSGSIFQRGSVYWVSFYRNGKRVFLSSRSSNRADAERLLAVCILGKAA